jgi:DNA-binding MarR family transcriptional regulator
MDKVDDIIAQWQRQRPDLDTRPMALIGRMKRLHDHLMAGHARVFDKLGLTAAGFDVLATLLRAGPPHALTPSELIARTMVASGTMTNRLDRLEHEGLVTRHRNPDDGRGFVVALTEAGLALIDQAVAEHVENQHRLVAALSGEDADRLDALLRDWLAAFESCKGK